MSKKRNVNPSPIFAFEKTGGPLLIAVAVENIPTMPEKAYRVLVRL